jgi:hypothetical protein
MHKRDFLFCLGLLLAKICFCQTVDTKSVSDGQQEARQKYFGVEIIASILPPAKITTDERQICIKITPPIIL